MIGPISGDFRSFGAPLNERTYLTAVQLTKHTAMSVLCGLILGLGFGYAVAEPLDDALLPVGAMVRGSLAAREMAAGQRAMYGAEVER
jgi:predicted lysophospholipase L1 biosynthesis ABC-type transport system permease subunit